MTKERRAGRNIGILVIDSCESTRNKTFAKSPEAAGRGKVVLFLKPEHARYDEAEKMNSRPTPQILEK